MRYQIELGPRMPSTRTSTASRRLAAAGYWAFHTSSAAIASSLVLVRAISINGIDDALRPDFDAPFGAFSAGPASLARSSSPSREPAASSMPSHGSPMSAYRAATVAKVKDSGTQSGTSCQCSGVDTLASARERTEYADATVRSLAFWLKSTKTR